MSNRLISFFLIICLLAIPVKGYTALTAYEEDLYHNYVYFSKSQYAILSDNNNYAYALFASELDKCNLALEFAGFVAEKEYDTVSVTRIMSQFMLYLDYELSEIHLRQSDIDQIKDWKEYLLDGIALATDFIGVKSSITDYLDKRLYAISDALSLTNSTIDLLTENHEIFLAYDALLNKYEMYDELLGAIAQHAEDQTLRKVASDMRSSAAQALQIRLERFGETSESFAVYLAKDVLFDAMSVKIMKEMGGNPILLEAIGSYITHLDTIKDIAGAMGDLVVGISDMLYRVYEIRIMDNIARALVRTIDTLNIEIEKGYNPTQISKACMLLESLLKVHARGEYSLYRLLISEDKFKLQSLFSNRSDVENWYKKSQHIHKLIASSLVGIYPNKEYYIEYYEDAFINALIEQKEIWTQEPYVRPVLEFIDIDLDGNNELLMSGWSGGSNNATYCTIFKYDEENDKIVVVDSEIYRNDLFLLEDSNGKQEYYFEHYDRDGEGIYFLGLVPYSAIDNYDFIFSAGTDYEFIGEDILEIAYYRVANNNVDKEAFKQFVDDFAANHSIVHFESLEISLDDWLSSNTDDQYEMLLQSYEAHLTDSANKNLLPDRFYYFFDYNWR